MNAIKIDLNKICKDYGIRACSYESNKNIIKMIGLDPLAQPGIAFKTTDGTPVILFRDGRPDLETRFTVAHELGHILLGHLDYRESFYGKYPDFAESEANYFAVSILTHDIICKYGQAN